MKEKIFIYIPTSLPPLPGKQHILYIARTCTVAAISQLSITVVATRYNREHPACSPADTVTVNLFPVKRTEFVAPQMCARSTFELLNSFQQSLLTLCPVSLFEVHWTELWKQDSVKMLYDMGSLHTVSCLAGAVLIIRTVPRTYCWSSMFILHNES